MYPNGKQLASQAFLMCGKSQENSDSYHSFHSTRRYISRYPARRECRTLINPFEETTAMLKNSKTCILVTILCAILMSLTLSQSLSATEHSQKVFPFTTQYEAAKDAHYSLRLAQYQQCSERIGPFATQDTAWQRWRTARSQGYAVSSGVFPCYDYDTRGYCFNVFYPC